MQKIKIRDTCPMGSIANVFFSIQKGKIVSVPDNFKVDESVFEIVEDSKGNKLEAKPLISDMEAKAFLQIANFSNFKSRINELSLVKSSLNKLYEFEKAGKKRKEWMIFLGYIPEAVDDGTEITGKGMLFRELLSIEGVNGQLAESIVTKYNDRKTIVDKLSNNRNDIEQLSGVTHEILESMLSHFKVVKSKVTTKKTMFGG